MSEPITTQTVEPETQPQAVNVDIDNIVLQASAKATEAAEKKMEAVFKSMLQQQGLDTETINTMTADWKAKNKPQEPKNEPKTNDIVDALKPLMDEIQALKDESAKIKNERNERQQLEYLESKEVPKEQLRYYRYEINQLVNDETSFEEAAAQFMTANPPIKRPPEFHVGSGRAVMTLPTTIDEYKKLSYDQKLELKEKNPGLYDKFKKMLGFK